MEDLQGWLCQITSTSEFINPSISHYVVFGKFWPKGHAYTGCTLVESEAAAEIEVKKREESDEYLLRNSRLIWQITSDGKIQSPSGAIFDVFPLRRILNE